MRPGVFYRHEFRRQILAERPRRVLEVGSGDGGLLRAMYDAGVQAEGIEADAAKVELLRAAGFVVQHVQGEELPFADDRFDLVVSEHAAHHFADLSRHLREAMRVARRAVFVLDPWYDLSIASQHTTLRWDRWFKAI